jgi:hypothetical protein
LKDEAVPGPGNETGCSESVRAWRLGDPLGISDFELGIEGPQMSQFPKKIEHWFKGEATGGVAGRGATLIDSFVWYNIIEIFDDKNEEFNIEIQIECTEGRHMVLHPMIFEKILLEYMMPNYWDASNL